MPVPARDRKKEMLSLPPIYIDSLRVGYARNRDQLMWEHLLQGDKSLYFIIGASIVLAVIGTVAIRVWKGQWRSLGLLLRSLSMCLGHTPIELSWIRACSSLLLTLVFLLLGAVAITSVSTHIIAFLIFNDRFGIVQNLAEANASALNVYAYSYILDYPLESLTLG